jgi:hypothetical protein
VYFPAGQDAILWASHLQQIKTLRQCMQEAVLGWVILFNQGSLIMSDP